MIPALVLSLSLGLLGLAWVVLDEPAVQAAIVTVLILVLFGRYAGHHATPPGYAGRHGGRPATPARYAGRHWATPARHAGRHWATPARHAGRHWALAAATA